MDTPKLLLLLLLLISIGRLSCMGQSPGDKAEQTAIGTFQGEITDASPFILHLRGNGDEVTGFYKYLSDSVAIRLEGSIDSTGYFVLAGPEKPHPLFFGKLRGRSIEGRFIASKKEIPRAFYACNFRGEYHSFSITLSEKGYILKGESRNHSQGPITTHRQEDGHIFLRCDSLNAKLYLQGDTLVADTTNGRPLFMWPDDEGSTFPLMDDFFDSGSFAEFPEKDETRSPDATRISVNDSLTLEIRQIPRSQYIVSKWEAARLHPKPYKVIKDADKAEKMLKGRVRFIPDNNMEGKDWRPSGLKIKYKDGTQKMLHFGGYSLKDYFIEYYPRLGIVILEHEASGDYPVDLNDSSNEHYVGVPSYRAASPDGRLRINGYYPGGAYDTDLWFIEKWNAAKKKYEYAGNLQFDYAHGWLWTNNDTVLFTSHQGGQNCYELQIVLK